MARIEGVYQKWLKTIPKEKITTLSPQQSQEIQLAISDVFSKKIAIARQKQKRSWYLIKEHFYSTLEKLNNIK